MVPTILPVWLLGTAIGIVAIALVGLIVCRVRKKRKQGTSRPPASFPIPSEAGPSAAAPFHQDLCLMQIDAVFDGLAALIETERLKLKRMMTAQGPVHTGEPLQSQPAALLQSEGTTGGGDSAADSVSETANAEASVMDAREMASRFGVSVAEAELAMKFQNISSLGGNHRLEAVA
jgi:hypothetical protein